MERSSNSTQDWTLTHYRSAEQSYSPANPRPLQVPPRNTTPSNVATPTGDSRTPGNYPTEPSSSSTQQYPLSQFPSVQESVSNEAQRPRKTEIYLEWIMVLVVLCAAVYFAIRNNTPDIIFNLCTLCFGYYFRSITTREAGSIK